jgi:hypothetical protein
MTVHRFSIASQTVRHVLLAWALVALLVVALAPNPLYAQVCDGNVFLGTQAQVDDFNCTSVTGNLSMIFTGITNLDGLSELTLIGGRLIISDNDALANVDGLSSLFSVGDDMVISGNGALTNVDGLSSLTLVSGDMHLEDHAALANVDGLSLLTSVRGNLSVEDNPELARCCGLFPLLEGFGVNVGGRIVIRNTGAGCLGQDILDGGMCTALAVEETTWGRTKTLYR